MHQIPLSLLLLLLICPLQTVLATTCSFRNELASLSWKVRDNELEIHFEHNNLTESRWTSIAFGDGPGMNNLEAIIFSRGDNAEVTTSTGFTPKKKRVVVDDVAYVTVKNVSVTGNQLKVTVTRPLGPAGPRDFSLNQCVNWIIVPGGNLKDGKFHKHHGKLFTIKSVCAAKCTSFTRRLLSNRIE
ncbi:unnamed protein product [Caenorhabditis sp. 36 PRJEB53466]|nr:unnamed protein product [Caenorhabditis sp. 36 PRJEB53466]